MKQNIPYGRQYIDDEDIREVVKVLKGNFLTQGPTVPEFEKRLAEYCGSKYAVVFNSGTSALHGAYFSLGLGKGDEFITSPITFVATSNAGLYLGAKPVFIDVEPDTGNIDTTKIEKKITKKTKLITPVHYAGHPVNMDLICRIAREHKFFIVEDACHALGAKYKGQGSLVSNQQSLKNSKSSAIPKQQAFGNWTKTGSCNFSDMTVLSFHPVKHITTGEGGAVLTNNEEFYKKLLMFRSHGITKDKSKFKNQNSKLTGDWYYEMQLLGYNYRMTDIQAALGISQLKKLDRFVEKRRAIADIYRKAFTDNPFFDIPPEKPYAFSSYHLYPIRLKDKYRSQKIEIFTRLRKSGLGVQVHYIPVHLQPYYSTLCYKKGLCPVAEDFYQKEISLPMYPAIKHKDLQIVIKKVLESFYPL